MPGCSDNIKGHYKRALYLTTDAQSMHCIMVYLGSYPWRNCYLFLLWWIFPCKTVKCQFKMVRLERGLCSLILWDWHQKLTFRRRKGNRDRERERKGGEWRRKRGKRGKANRVMAHAARWLMAVLGIPNVRSETIDQRLNFPTQFIQQR